MSLPIPVTHNEAAAAVLAPVLPLLDGLLVTTAELAKHWRLSPDYLSNMRQRAADGPPHIKLPSGSVRYRLSDILRHEMRGQRGVSADVLRAAIMSCPEIPIESRDRAAKRVLALCFGAAA